VNEDPVNLDKHRGMAAQRDAEIRRDIREVQVDQAALRGRQEELEDRLLAAPAATPAEAAASARYLIQLFAATPEAQDPPPAETHCPRARRPQPFRQVTSPP
jgi:hypothetical protein